MVEQESGWAGHLFFFFFFIDLERKDCASADEWKRRIPFTLARFVCDGACCCFYYL